jgi:hypothetical protein
MRSPVLLTPAGTLLPASNNAADGHFTIGVIDGAPLVVNIFTNLKKIVLAPSEFSGAGGKIIHDEYLK